MRGKSETGVFVMSDFHRFDVGRFRCAAVNDGGYDYDPAGFFNGVPENEYRAELVRTGITTEKLRTPYTSVVVETGSEVILVDTGAGSLAPTTGLLPTSLANAGFPAESISIVAITHAHPDHIGGVLDAERKPRYPNARYVIPRLDWEFWFSDEAERTVRKHPVPFVEMARGALKPVESRTTLLEFGDEIAPGVSFVEAAGHTPGHAMVAFRSGAEKFMFGSDAIVLALHIEHPDWNPDVYHLDPKRADATKRRVADLIADENWLAIFQHFYPFPSLGRIEKNGDAWRWVPEG
ncbi:MAG: MBL fold metallo-hydrolase [Spirochaetaceae bacterium]|nr:MAG: MBL fold metallo-hydrolase [Spirochaetaceae bacterium]